MADVAQLVRASVCGTEGRGFESHHSPQNLILEIALSITTRCFLISELLTGNTFGIASFDFVNSSFGIIPKTHLDAFNFASFIMTG